MEEMLAVNHLEGGPLLAHCSRNKDNGVLIEHAFEGNAGLWLPYKGTIFCSLRHNWATSRSSIFTRGVTVGQLTKRMKSKWLFNGAKTTR